MKNFLGATGVQLKTIKYIHLQWNIVIEVMIVVWNVKLLKHVDTQLLWDIVLELY